MRSVVVIPARMNSYRLPGKVLAKIDGKPMIVHTVNRALETRCGEVIVATPDDEVEIVVGAYFEDRVSTVLTERDCPSGTDRVWQAVRERDDLDIVVNLQADAPFEDPLDVRRCIEHKIRHPEADVVTLVSPLHYENLHKPEVVKAWITDDDRLIDCRRRVSDIMVGEPMHKHGLYVYDYKALETFVNMPINWHEKQEGLEQLRGLLSGLVYHAVRTHNGETCVDTPEQLQELRKKLDYLK